MKIVLILLALVAENIEKDDYLLCLTYKFLQSTKAVCISIQMAVQINTIDMARYTGSSN